MGILDREAEVGEGMQYQDMARPGEIEVKVPMPKAAGVYPEMPIPPMSMQLKNLPGNLAKMVNGCRLTDLPATLTHFATLGAAGTLSKAKLGELQGLLREAMTNKYDDNALEKVRAKAVRFASSLKPIKEGK